MAALNELTVLDWLVQLACASVAIYRILIAADERAPHGWWSRGGWIAVSLLVTAPLGPLVIPLGALCAAGRFGQPRPQPRPGEVPVAEGDPGAWQ